MPMGKQPSGGQTKIENSRQELIVSDDNVQQRLVQILKELKKINLHQTIITDNHFENDDVEI